MDKNTLYANGLPVGTVVGIDWARGEPGASELVDKVVHSITVDELADAKLKRQIDVLNAAATFPFSAMPGLSAWLAAVDGGMLWGAWRTRNLSHRPAAGARKRKAALKHAARQHRTAMRGFHRG